MRRALAHAQSLITILSTNEAAADAVVASTIDVQQQVGQRRMP